MAYTQADLDNVEAAIASGELDIMFGDGRRIMYRTIADLMKAADYIKQSLSDDETTDKSKTARPTAFRMVVDNGR